MIHLGKLALYHCDACNLPLLKATCTCGAQARHVNITPPGDIRPAFKADRALLAKIVTHQFGSSYVPVVVLLNSAPDIDKKDEVIIDGMVAGNLVYDIWKERFVFQPYTWYVSLLSPSKGIVVADPGAIDSLLKSSNLMAPGVMKAHPDIIEGDEVAICNDEGIFIATGKARMDGAVMGESKGMAVKVRHRGISHAKKGKSVTWNEVVAANEDVIKSMAGREQRFISKVIQEQDLPFVVSFSGGKDSLATLLLVLEAGFHPPLLFLDTGLEFEETIHHVHEIVDKFGLEIIEGDAANAFWQAVDFFGIPAKDFRWCCKTCKLGVAARVLKQRFPNGVLSFIGQRRYESEHRFHHGKIWKNPWVHGQIAASPIQNWTALHVWLYLFWKNVPWNPLYEQGFARIGCWLCPASDMGEFSLKKHTDWSRYEIQLRKFKKQHNLPDEWLRLGLWRWRNPPNWSTVSYAVNQQRTYPVKGNEHYVENALRTLGNVEKIGDNCFHIGDIEVTCTDNAVQSSRCEDTVRDIIYRALHCVGCGVCIAKCEHNAIEIRDGKAWIGDGCRHCLECMDECTVLVFG